MASNSTLCTYLLKMRYPAPELLPENKRPYLENPKDLGYREKPKLDTYHLNTKKLDFFVQLETSPVDIAPKPLDAESEKDITACIAPLSSAPGVSELSAVSWAGGSVFGFDEMITRFSLKTRWFTEQEGQKEIPEKRFLLKSCYWNQLVAAADPASGQCWITMMNDLIAGGSDRAVLHREKQFQGYDGAYANCMSDESYEEEKWDDKPESTPLQLLTNHLQDLNYEHKRVLDLSSYTDTSEIEVQLPCGMRQKITPAGLKALTREQCLSARCQEPFCHLRIMNLEDERLLALYDDRKSRAAWQEKETQWRFHDYSPSTSPLKTFITGPDLYASLKAALTSLSPPVFATPSTLDYTKFAATKIVLAHYRRHLKPKNGSVSLNLPAYEILALLRREAAEALKGANLMGELGAFERTLPPRFEGFVEGWVRRGFNCALPSRSRKRKRPCSP